MKEGKQRRDMRILYYQKTEWKVGGGVRKNT